MIATHARETSPIVWLAAAPDDRHDKSQKGGEDRAGAVAPLRILIVEDEFFISLDTKALLESLGHTVVAIAVSADQAIAAAERDRPDVVLMDIRLIGPRDGIDAADEIRSRLNIGCIFVTANTDPGTRQRAQAVHPISFLEKPLTPERLHLALSAIDNG